MDVRDRPWDNFPPHPDSWTGSSPFLLDISMAGGVGILLSSYLSHPCGPGFLSLHLFRKEKMPGTPAKKKLGEFLCFLISCELCILGKECFGRKWKWNEGKGKKKSSEFFFAHFSRSEKVFPIADLGRNNLRFECFCFSGPLSQRVN